MMIIYLYMSYNFQYWYVCWSD